MLFMYCFQNIGIQMYKFKHCDQKISEWTFTPKTHQLKIYMEYDSKSIIVNLIHCTFYIAFKHLLHF